jgi:Flp pilus assembly pilin Flp
MFKKLLKNKKAQNTAEYAILISLVVAGIIAMQTYAQRALQARVRDASQYLANQTADLGSSQQYEPYYLESDYTVERDTNTTERLGAGLVGMEEDSTTTRQAGGFQESRYGIGDNTVMPEQL